MPSYDEDDPKPALWLVGDAGIYLMSNGSPAISWGGDLIAHDDKTERLRLMAPAEGCDTSDDIDLWWPIHNAVSGGDDFTIVIALDEVDNALETADRQIVIVVGKRTIYAMSDATYDKDPMRE